MLSGDVGLWYSCPMLSGDVGLWYSCPVLSGDIGSWYDAAPYLTSPLVLAYATT